jgi:hypothetical protein
MAFSQSAARRVETSKLGGDGADGLQQGVVDMGLAFEVVVLARVGEHQRGHGLLDGDRPAAVLGEVDVGPGAPLQLHEGADDRGPVEHGGMC